MDPTGILLTLMVVVVALGVAANRLQIEPRRSCPECDESVPLSARTCHVCHYRFS